MTNRRLTGHLEGFRANGHFSTILKGRQVPPGVRAAVAGRSSYLHTNTCTTCCTSHDDDDDGLAIGKSGIRVQLVEWV